MVTAFNCITQLPISLHYVIYFKNNCGKNAQRLYFLRISSTIFEPGAL